MKRKLFFMGALAVIMAGAIFWSCQKDEVLMNAEDGVMLKSVIADYPESCDNVCIDLSLGDDVIYYFKSDQKTVQWGGSTGTNNTKNVDLKYYNTETYFVIEYNSTHSPQNLIIDGDDVSEDVISLSEGWFQYSIELEEGWEACNKVEYFVRIDGSGPPADFGKIEYELIGVCEDECTSWQTETAWGGNTEGLGSAWWYYFDGNNVQDIWAGQNEKAGTIELIEGVINIKFIDGWELNPVSINKETGEEYENTEPVKIQGYSQGNIPVKRPTAGQFETYKGTSLEPNVSQYDYYAIHLDVRKCEN